MASAPASISASKSTSTPSSWWSYIASGWVSVHLCCSIFDGPHFEVGIYTLTASLAGPHLGCGASLLNQRIRRQPLPPSLSASRLWSIHGWPYAWSVHSHLDRVGCRQQLHPFAAHPLRGQPASPLLNLLPHIPCWPPSTSPKPTSRWVSGHPSLAHSAV